jgi:hypothetical protein
MVHAKFLEYHSLQFLDFEAFFSGVAEYSFLFSKELCTQQLEIYVEIFHHRLLWITNVQKDRQFLRTLQFHLIIYSINETSMEAEYVGYF